MFKIYILLWSWLVIHLAAGANFDSLSNEDVFKGLSGFSVPGYNDSKLSNELGGEDAARFIGRCKNDPDLRRFLTAFITLVSDSNLRDDLVSYVLREDSVWIISDANDPLNSKGQMQRDVFAMKFLGGLFFISPGDPEMEELIAALKTHTGRMMISRIYEDVNGLRPDERDRQNPEMMALVTRLKKSLVERDYSKPDKPALRPRKDFPRDEKADASRTGDMAKEKSDRSKFPVLGIFAGLLFLGAAVGWIRSRRRRASLG
jgi:hypothetical protein